MGVDDAARAEAIASRMLVRDNPPSDDELEAKLKLRKVMLELAAEGVNVKSLGEPEWRGHLEAMGLGADEITDALEEIASWGVTDDD